LLPLEGGKILEGFLEEVMCKLILEKECKETLPTYPASPTLTQRRREKA
jgi:hypothetical protein